MAKLTELQSVDNLSVDDFIYLVDTPASNAVSKKCTVGQLLTLLGSSTLPEINVLNYGVLGDGSTDDAVKMQAAMNAAYDLGLAKLVIPNTLKNVYMLSNTIYNTTVPSRGQLPTVTAVDTATGIVTWSKPHLLNTGDPIMNQGYAWGGLSVKTQYYASKVDSLRIKYYDTQANALAGGSTGQIVFTSGVTTTGSIASGTNQLTVGAVLASEKGTDVRMAGVVNNNGEFFIRSIAGNKITLNANASGQAINGTVTFVSSMDWRYYRTGLRVEVAEGVTIKKTAGFTGTSLFNISNTHGVIWRGGRLEGLTPDLNATINQGDDGLRFNSTRLLLVEGVNFFYFGDAFLRIATSTGDPVGATNSHPLDGVGQTGVDVRQNYAYACHQLSSTTNDFLHGGGSEIRIDGNTFENIRGSIKLANRVPGSQNIFLTDNTIKSSLDKGFEIDSLQNVTIDRNVISNVGNFGIFITPNNGPAASPSGDGSGVTGFPFNNYKIRNNFFVNCGYNTNCAAIRFAMDLYQDGFVWDYSNVEICGNQFLAMANTSCFGIIVVSGSFRNFKIKDNIFDGFNGSKAINLLIRGSTVSGFINNVDVSDNTITMNNSSGTAVWIQQNTVLTGPEFISDVHLKNNKIYGVCTTAYSLGNLKNVYMESNRTSLTSGQFLQTITGTSLQEVYLDHNRSKTGSTTGYAFSNINGLYLHDNTSQTPSGTTYDVGNTCQNVWFRTVDNKSIGGTPNLHQVPVNSIGIGVTGRWEIGTSAPTSGTWNQGDRVLFSNVVAGGVEGTYCITKGTAGSITGSPTGATDGTTNTFTASDITQLAIGAFINVAGAWTGGRTVTAINTTTRAVTVDGAVPAGVSPAAISYVAPVFKTLAPIAS